MPWRFEPEKPREIVTIGEREMAFYTAKNLSARTVTGTATFNVTPVQAGKYFTKIQCFCFTEQTLKPGEEVRMPVVFFVDPKILAGPRRQGDQRNHPELHLLPGGFGADEEARDPVAGDASRRGTRTNMAGAKNHPYHLVNPSIWPLVGAFSGAGAVRRRW